MEARTEDDHDAVMAAHASALAKGAADAGGSEAETRLTSAFHEEARPTELVGVPDPATLAGAGTAAEPRGHDGHIRPPARSEPLPRSTALDVPDSTAEDPLVGTGYRALKRLGKGGFGEAWVALHETIGHRVVCKIIHSRHLDNPNVLERLRLEAETSARNPHPHLVNIFDLRKTGDGRPFVVMEYISGPSLHHLQKREFNHGPLPLRMAVEVIRQVLSALGKLHSSGVAHRDLKPDNIMIAERKPSVVVKVIDFGLAKVFDAEASIGASAFGGEPVAGTPRPLSVPTSSKALQGTPRYMAPEQIDKRPGAPIDQRADIWAVGAIMMKLLTGRPPFADHRSFNDILLATISEPIETPSSLLSEPLPPGLDELVLKALERDLSRRFASADEMLAALDAIDLDAVKPTFKTVPIVPPIEDDGFWVPEPSPKPPPTAPHVAPTEPMAPISAKGMTEAITDEQRAALAYRQHEQTRMPPSEPQLVDIAPGLAHELYRRQAERYEAAHPQASAVAPPPPPTMSWARFFTILGAVAAFCVGTALYFLYRRGYL